MIKFFGIFQQEKLRSGDSQALKLRTPTEFAFENSGTSRGV